MATRKSWQKPDGAKIELAVAIVKTASLDPKPDPLLVFFGNPGYGISISYVLPFLFEEISSQRDMIIIDQRGTGFSKPSFDCPELNSLSTSVIAKLTLQEANDQLAEASDTCAMKIKASVNDLSIYNSVAEATDLEYLRQVLGIRQWNIYSFWTGSRLALAMMREYPQGIRSVILDSPIPPQANPVMEWGVNAEMALDRFFKFCADDVACIKAYPNLKDTFYSLLDQLDAEPIQIDSIDHGSGGQFNVSLDGDQLIGFLLRLLSTVNNTEILPELPRMIYQLSDGKTEAIGRYIGDFSEVLTSSAMDLWIDCNEELSFFTLGQVINANGSLNPNLQKYFNTRAEGKFRACEAWNAPGISATENMPVASSVPTLLLTGEFDWLQPPAWAELTAQTLRQSTVVEFPGNGQLVYISSLWTDCSHKLVDNFLDKPTDKPDTSCATIPFRISWNTTP